MMNFNNPQKKTQQSESWQQNEVCVFLFIKKVVCWLVLLAVLENLMFFLFLLPFFFGTVHAHLWKKLGRIHPYNFKLIRSLHLEGCFCSSAANGCSAKKTGGISLQLCPENCQKLTAAAGATRLNLFCLLSAGVSFIFPCFTTFSGLEDNIRIFQSEPWKLYPSQVQFRIEPC